MIPQLQALLGATNVLTAAEDIIPYGFDGTATLRQRPRAVVFPRNAQEVSAVLKLAAQHRTPVVTRGSGTGLSGGSVPIKNGIVLCVLKMDRLIELDQKNLTLLAETGVITTANPGCHLQIQNGLRAAGDMKTEVVHPVVLLARAYAAEKNS